MKSTRFSERRADRMARPKKDNKAISVRLATNVYDRLNDFCERSGQSKTTAIERAIEMYVDEYDSQQEQLKSIHDYSVKDLI